MVMSCNALIMRALVLSLVFQIINGAAISKTQTSETNNPFAAIDKNHDVQLLNVGGELMYATRDTLAYLPNTILSSIAFSNAKDDSKLVHRDEKGRIFLDFSPALFKHALEQLRRWKNRNNRSADREILAPSWKVKEEFDQMLTSLGLGKYKQEIPIQCTTYNISDDPTRHIGSGIGKLCDQDLVGWTRFINRAGNAIIRKPPTIGCNSLKSGWLVGALPDEPWTTTLGSLCYIDELGIPCRVSNPIRTTNCGSFFVYDLQAPPLCPARVCTEHYNFDTI